MLYNQYQGIPLLAAPDTEKKFHFPNITPEKHPEESFNTWISLKKMDNKADSIRWLCYSFSSWMLLKSYQERPVMPLPAAHWAGAKQAL